MGSPNYTGLDKIFKLRKVFMQDFLNQRWKRFAICFHWGTFGILNHPVIDVFVDKCFSLLGLTTVAEKILSHHESGLVLMNLVGPGILTCPGFSVPYS